MSTVDKFPHAASIAGNNASASMRSTEEEGNLGGLSAKKAEPPTSKPILTSGPNVSHGPAQDMPEVKLAKETAFGIFETLSKTPGADIKDHTKTLASLANNLSPEQLSQVFQNALFEAKGATEDTIELAIREIRQGLEADTAQTLLRALSPLRYELSQITSKESGESTAASDDANSYMEAVATTAHEFVDNLENQMTKKFQESATDAYSKAILVIDTFSKAIDASGVVVDRLTQNTCEQVLKETLELVLNDQSNVESMKAETIVEIIKNKIKEAHEKLGSDSATTAYPSKDEIKSWLNDFKNNLSPQDSNNNTGTVQSINEKKDQPPEAKAPLSEVTSNNDTTGAVDTTADTPATPEKIKVEKESSSDEQRQPHPGVIRSLGNVSANLFLLALTVLFGWMAPKTDEQETRSDVYWRQLRTAKASLDESARDAYNSIFG